MNRRRSLIIDAAKIVATGMFVGAFLRAETLADALVLFALSVAAFAVALVLTPDEDEPR